MSFRCGLTQCLKWPFAASPNGVSVCTPYFRLSQKSQSSGKKPDKITKFNEHLVALKMGLGNLLNCFCARDNGPIINVLCT